MAEEISVVLSRSDSSGFGFSLLGKPGLPPIIYNILDDSPAAESGEVGWTQFIRGFSIYENILGLHVIESSNVVKYRYC